MGDWTDLLPRAGQGSGIPEFAVQALQSQSATRQNDAQTQVLGAQLQDLQSKAAKERDYQYDVAQYLRNPTPEATMAMFDKYPDQAKALSQGYAVKDEAARRSDIGYFGSLYSALDKGNTPLALASLKQRRDADKAAGLDTTLDDEWITALGNNDPTAIGTIKGAVLANLAAAAGRDKFADNFGAVGGSKVLKSASAGDWVYDQDGHIVFKVPQGDQYKSVGPGDSLVKIPGEGGGPASSPTGAVAPPVDGSGRFDPRQFFKQFVLPHEGGYSASDANGSPVNMGINQAANPGVDVRSLTADQAADIFVTKYASKAASLPPALAAVYADTAYINPKRAEQFLKASGGDAAKFLQLRRAWQNNLVAKEPAKYGRFAKAWRNRNNDLAGYVGGEPQSAGTGGGVSVVATGAPKPGYRPATPQEVAQYNLDPNVSYQVSPDGKVEPVGGQKGAAAGALKPWPAKTLDARITNEASIENIDSALRLLDPKNKSREAEDARNGIGFGTGALGEQYTNWNDPKGTPIRALIGQIGGIIIKDISGAAVSVSEDSRLSKWVPKVTDSPTVIRFKIQNLKREIALRNSVMDRVGRSQGYRPFGEEQGGAGASRAAPSRYSEGQTATGPKGQKIIYRNGRWGPL